MKNLYNTGQGQRFYDKFYWKSFRSIPFCFEAELINSLVPSIAWGSKTSTFTRATTATELDFDGKVVPILSGEARFGGARRVANLWTGAGLSTEDITTWSGAAGCSAVSASQINFTGSAALDRIGTGAGALSKSGKYVARFEAQAGTKSTMGLRVGSVNSSTLTIDGTRKLYSLTVTATSPTNAFIISADGANGTVNIWNMQIEYVEGQTNQNPGEYVSVGVESAPYHGAGVDGVKWFEHENGNTVTDNVVTEAQGAAIAASTLLGYHAEKAATNKALYSRTWENAAWVASNITPDDDSAVGVDGLTRAATLTATAGNGTVIQDLGVIASAAQAWGLWIKRKTGTGDIEITLDGGSTWTAVTVTAGWTRVQKTQTLADPDIGIRIVTSGDAVYVDFAQCETGTFLTSTIPETSGTAVTRNQDLLTFASAGNATTVAGTFYAEASSSLTVARVVAHIIRNGASSVLLYGDNGSGVNAQYSYSKAAGGTQDLASAAALLSAVSAKYAVTWGAAGGSLFYNGTSVGSSSNAMLVGTDFTTIIIGNSFASNAPLNGYIKNVRIFARALSAAQIGAL